ncbi:hypothetical protein [Actinomadura rupiterrae]|uniref:hypothetical protein n=1 Tax=Actinomadura rupiterrae TaxID=559627 RepID=UPI0020A25EA5|nr:hypothetical protein [Actinomadura rupiterrae]MCP2339151.1 hypothetical protein [Actinomadura rupiterrae]
MQTPSFEEFLLSAQLDAQFSVAGVQAGAGCWKGEWLYALKRGDGPGTVHVMQDAASALRAVSKALAGTLEKI